MLATALVASGVLLVIIGAVRHDSSRTRIDARTFRPASRSIMVTTVVASLTGLIAIIFVWLAQRPA